jgi:hypothetical protein
MSNTDHTTKKPGVISEDLLVYTVKSGESLGSDRGKKTSRLKVKDS